MTHSRSLLDAFKPIQPEMVKWRRHLHTHPELSHQEFQTADYIRKVLKDMGIKETRTLAGTGVVAEIGTGKGPKVGLRADIDALPIEEKSGESFSSKTPGVMHACGHDAHTAALLGAARYLKSLDNDKQLPGTVRLIFQPAEETQDEKGKSGGQKMTEEGVVEGLDAIFAQHVTPSLDAGKLSVRSGPVMAASDYFVITIHGKSAHAAMPHLSIDPIAIAGPLISALHQISGRKVHPKEQAVITIGTIHGGSQNNIVADKVILKGTIRSFTPEVRTTLIEEIRKLALIAEALGGTADIEIQSGYPVTVNNPVLTDIALKNVSTLLGEEVLAAPLPPTTGAEDFGFMSAQIPGCYMRLGVKQPGWARSYPVHTEDFRLDEDALLYGAANLAAQAVGFLNGQG